MFTVGIIGTGKIAGLYDKPDKTNKINTHSQAIYNNPHLKLISTVNPNKKENDLFCNIWSVNEKNYNIEKFLKSDIPDIITICSPNATHFEIAAKILRNEKKPKVLFIEKPVCLTNLELKTLLKLKQRSECEIFVNHTRRFDPTHLKLKKLISSGIMGSILSGRFTYYGGLFNNGVHVIDLIIYLLGCDFNSTNIVTQNYGKLNDPCIDFDLLFNNYTISINSFDEKYYQLFEGELKFSNGRILYNDFGRLLKFEKVIKNKIGERELKHGDENNIEGLISPLRHSYDSILNYLNNKQERIVESRIEDIKIVMDRLFEIKEKNYES